MPMLERPISKAGWTRVAFGDVVRLSKARVADPEAAGIERVVGLEHIEPGDLRIRRWGDVADGTTFTTLFKPGQVLFGKRRAYQRKVAVADFEGVCSGDIYVLEPANDRLMPELLPFLCQTDAFFDHAVGTSAGSLSPRTNWTSLASFEFLLPPIQEQARIISAMQAAADLRSELGRISDSMSNLAEALIRRSQEGDGRTVTLDQVCEKLSVGLAISTSQAFRETGVPLIRNQNIRPSGLNTKDMIFLDPKFADLHSTKRVETGDIVTTRTGANIGQTCVIPEAYSGAHTFTTLIIRTRKSELNPEFLAAHMNSLFGVVQIEKLSTSGGKNNLNVEGLRKYQLVLPQLENQSDFISALAAARESSRRTVERVAQLETLIRQTSLAGMGAD
jgi:type I restriction enzyme S subunit